MEMTKLTATERKTLLMGILAGYAAVHGQEHAAGPFCPFPKPGGWGSNWANYPLVYDGPTFTKWDAFNPESPR
jgi:hypothetical protein